MTETKIYVGLNDSVTMKQKLDTDRYINILKDVCRGYGVAFSFSLQEGGYFHENGDYTQENSLVITLIDGDSVLIEEIAKDLCAFFHQESVLVTETEINARYISASL